jgi:hypothetical protein
MSVTITPAVGDPLELTPIPGTLEYGDGHDDRGGSVIPNARAGLALNGSMEVLVTDVVTIAALQALRSGVGEGDVEISGDAEAYACLLDVEITGDAVQTARLTWKGTTDEV